MGTEVVQKQQNTAALEWQALKESATYAFKSGLLPGAIRTPEQAVTIALMGRELGLSVMASLTGIYVVNGMPILRAATMLRLIYERVPGAKITIITPADQAHKECEVEMARPGGNPQRFKYTMDDAKKGGFASKQVWSQHPSTMLRWAAIRTGARIVFADAIAGCYMEDEIPDKGEVHVSEPKVESVQRDQAKVTPVQELPQISEKAGEGNSERISRSDYDALISYARDQQGYSNKEITEAIFEETKKTQASDLTPEELERVRKRFEAPKAKNQKEGVSSEGLISEKQIRRLFAVAKENNWSNDDIHDYLSETYQIESVKNIHWTKYEDFIKFMKEHPLHKDEESDFAPGEEIPF